jgi:hypothetical protein
VTWQPGEDRIEHPYDTLRKSAAALLAVQGLRATSRGGHVAIQDAVTALTILDQDILSALGEIRSRFAAGG